MSLKIRRLETTGGYLEKAPIEFNDALTCIIGSRGTCKSTIVETLRFVFDCDTKRISEMVANERDLVQTESPAHSGIIRATLGAATARCLIMETGVFDESLSLERETDATEPRIYRDGVKELVDRSVLSRIEIYSQGELQRIAEDSGRRLELIDRPNKKEIDKLRKEQSLAAQSLKKLGQDIRTWRTGIESRRADLKALEGFRLQLQELQGQRPELSPEMDFERNAFEYRRAILERVASLSKRRGALLETAEHLADSQQEFHSLAKELESLDVPESKSLSQLFKDFAKVLETIKIQAGTVRYDLNPEVSRLETRVEKLNEKYYSLRQSQQALNEVLKKEDQVKQQIKHLERISQEVAEWTQLLLEAQERRKALRRQISELSDQIFQLRIQQVEQINSNFSDKVLLTLNQGGRSHDYRENLGFLLERSRLRNQDDIARDISARILPSDLVDIVESGDSARISELLERDLGQMARLVGYLLDSPELYNLETTIFDDELEITLYDEGVPKRVDQLSKGQKATAMLPLILRHADYPLVFDQPEDDLDNRFIYETLVDRIRELKRTRQVIFVTHNANIPVLGDAEQVVVMKMETPRKAGAPIMGNVEEVKDKILNLLEGGSEAFKKRQQKYGALIS